MISHVNFNNKMYRLSYFDGHSYLRQNSTTIIVGKNGTGKSRLLAKIVSEVMDGRFNERDYLGEFSGILAVSTSPFDKFPVVDKVKKNHIKYNYIGLKGRNGSGSGSVINLISAAMEGVVAKVASGLGWSFVHVMNELNFLPTMQLVFKVNNSRNVALENYYISNEGSSNNFATRANVEFEPIGHMNDRADFGGSLGVAPDVELNKIYGFRDEVTPINFGGSGWHNKIHDRFGYGGWSSNYSKEYYDDFELDSNGNFMVELNLDDGGRCMEVASRILYGLQSNSIRVMDFRVSKLNSNFMSIRRASSGEQCMLVSLLGIFGYINNNYLILIDEPEISLHPEWQCRYIELINKLFSDFVDCQFIIATHSPQVVSGLSGNNNFVLNVLTNELLPARDYVNRSSDFQLAEVFGAPGVRNEYISRLAMNAIAKIKSNGCVDYDDIAVIDKLKNYQNNISKSDPVFDLIETVSAVGEYYANNK